MGILPYLDAPEQSAQMIQQFGGYNHRISIGENEFYDMKNMSAKDFPLISARDKRGTIDIGEFGTIETAQGIVAKDKLIIPFVGNGSNGVTVAENIGAQDVLIDGTEIDGKWYSKIPYDNAEHIQKVLTSISEEGEPVKIKNSEFFMVPDGTIDKDSDAREILYKSDGAYLAWPHKGVGYGEVWGIPLFYLRNNTAVSNNETGGSAEGTIYAGYICIHDAIDEVSGKEMWLCQENGSAVQKVTVEETGDVEIVNGYAQRRIKFSWQGKMTLGGYLKHNTWFVLPMTDPGTNLGPEEISEYIYSKVKVTAENDFSLNSLAGQTVKFGSASVEVERVSSEQDEKFIHIRKPHDALEAGSTSISDRLYLAEIDPQSGEMQTTNICSKVNGKRFLIEMGGNLVVFPEKVIVNTLDKDIDGRFKNIQLMEMKSILKTKYNYQLCDISGNTYSDGSVGNTAPENPSNGMAWIDNSKTPPTLKVWSEQTSQWAVTQAYCRIASEAISSEWESGDAIELKFSEAAENLIVPIKDQKYFVISEVGEIEDDDGNKTGERFIRFPASMSDYKKVEATTPDESIEITRTVPDMDFVIECKNRLWGCKYGMVDGKMINEIFASKLGDAKNWHHFTNTAIDSYYVSTGNDGGFTGAGSYKNNPVFFREDCFHIIFGDYPAAYGLQTVACHGLEKGSDKGITVMNDVMFYKSPVGVMAYTGATPVNITECFGKDKYKNAISCSLGNKMYFSMENSGGERTLFAFDDGAKLWHKEDSLDVKDFAVYDGEIYALTQEGRILSMTGVNGTEEEDFEWSIESGNIGYNTPFRKRITKINLRLFMETTAKAGIYIQYDSCGSWQHISNIRPYGKVRSITAPIMPHRCDHFALKIEGTGDFRILSLTKYTEDGSDAD